MTTFSPFAAKQGFIKKGIVLSRGKKKGNLQEKSLYNITVTLQMIIRS